MTTKKIREIEAQNNAWAQGELRHVAQAAQEVGKQQAYVQAYGYRKGTPENWVRLNAEKKEALAKGIAVAAIEETAERFQMHGKRFAEAVVERDQRNSRRKLGKGMHGERSANER